VNCGNGIASYLQDARFLRVFNARRVYRQVNARAVFLLVLLDVFAFKGERSCVIPFSVLRVVFPIPALVSSLVTGLTTYDRVG